MQNAPQESPKKPDKQVIREIRESLNMLKEQVEAKEGRGIAGILTIKGVPIKLIERETLELEDADGTKLHKFTEKGERYYILQTEPNTDRVFISKFPDQEMGLGWISRKKMDEIRTRDMIIDGKTAKMADLQEITTLVSRIAKMSAVLQASVGQEERTQDALKKELVAILSIDTDLLEMEDVRKQFNEMQKMPYKDQSRALKTIIDLISIRAQSLGQLPIEQLRKDIESRYIPLPEK